jgi:hypothetical protein
MELVRMDFPHQPSAKSPPKGRSGPATLVVISFRMTDLPSWSPLSRFRVVGTLDHKVPNPHVSFRCSKRAGFGPSVFASLRGPFPSSCVNYDT